MHGFALGLMLVLSAPLSAEGIDLTIADDAPQLTEDVVEIHERHFAMPLHIVPGRKDKIKHIGLYVSQDSGRTWKHLKDYEPSDKQVTFEAPRDGVYWFALRVVFKDGDSEPAKTAALTVGQKVYVNSERKALTRR